MDLIIRKDPEAGQDLKDNLPPILCKDLACRIEKRARRTVRCIRIAAINEHKTCDWTRDAGRCVGRVMVCLHPRLVPERFRLRGCRPTKRLSEADLPATYCVNLQAVQASHLNLSMDGPQPTEARWEIVLVMCSRSVVKCLSLLLSWLPSDGGVATSRPRPVAA
jgi:hypothetical protein